MATMTWNDDDRAPYIVPRIYTAKEIVDRANMGLTACEAIKQYFIEERERLYIKTKGTRDHSGLGSPRGVDYWSYSNMQFDSEDEAEAEVEVEQEEVEQVVTAPEEPAAVVEAEPLDDPLYRDHNKFAYT